MSSQIMPSQTGPCPAAPPPPAVSYGIVHVGIPPAERWRCVVWNRGPGTVTGTHMFAGVAAAHRVELDSGDDLTVLPHEARRVANLRLVQP